MLRTLGEQVLLYHIYQQSKYFCTIYASRLHPADALVPALPAGDPPDSRRAASAPLDETTLSARALPAGKGDFSFYADSRRAMSAPLDEAPLSARALPACKGVVN